MTGRVPVTVVAGASASGKSRLIAQLRATCPPGERWALLSNSPGGPLDPAAGGGQKLGLAVVPADQYFEVAGGCACCTAGPVFRTALVRLLRAGPWGRVHVEVDPAGHPHLLIDQLRAPPFDQYLEVSRLLLTLRDADAVPYRAAPDFLDARVGFATDFLLQAIAADPVSPFAAWLESAPPWPRLERVAGRSLVRTDSGLFSDLPGWRVFSALQPSDTPENFDLVRQWPARTLALRRPLKDLLSALASDSSVTGFQALMRTPRAWYCWRFGRGRGAGALAFNAGSELTETETGWRFDNRICVWLRPGARRRAIEARMQGLELALQDSDSLLDPAVS